jgi:hypothetical protein
MATTSSLVLLMSGSNSREAWTVAGPVGSRGAIQVYVGSCARVRTTTSSPTIIDSRA